MTSYPYPFLCDPITEIRSDIPTERVSTTIDKNTSGWIYPVVDGVCGKCGGAIEQIQRNKYTESLKSNGLFRCECGAMCANWRR